MANQEVDTFATGGRGASNAAGSLSAGQTVTAWSPASGGPNWIAQTAPSAFSFTGTKGQTTGANSQNIVTLNDSGGKLWYSSIVSARFSKSAANDNVGVVARLKDVNNYYRAEVTAGNLNLISVVNNVAKTLATVACGFTDSGANNFWIKLQIQGFGLAGTVNNIQAKAWLDSNSEPATYQISASDASLVQPGYSGIRIKGNSNGNTQAVDSFLATDPAQYAPAPTYTTLFDLPYGDTNYVSPNNPPPYPSPLAQQTLSDIAAIGNGAVIRDQTQWQQIEIVSGFYQWEILDDKVYRANQAGVRFWLCLQGAPSFRLARDSYGNNTTLSAQATSGTPYASISVAALPTGAEVPHQGQITIDYGAAHPETVYVWNPGHTYTGGATTIGISTNKNSQVAWTPAFTHSIGAQIYEQSGLNFPSAAEMATYATAIASRYNGTAGYGKIDLLQVGNEEWDTGSRVGVQSASWDNGGAILAPVYVAAYNAIKAAHPSCTVVACSVRKTPTGALAHITNWLTGLCAGVSALGGSLDGLDAHYYRDGTTDWNGTPVQDPTQNTYADSGHATINAPNITLELWTMKNVAAQYGFSPQLNIGEFGWQIYDDGLGFSATTNATLTAGATVTTIGVASLSSNVPDGTPIFVDTGGAKPEGPVYAWGTTNSNGGATTIPVTTNPAGKSSVNNAQVAWVPASTHTSPVTLYMETGGGTISLSTDRTYTQAMYDAGRAIGAAHMLHYTMTSGSSVRESVTPVWADAPRGWTQTYTNTYLYAPGYYLMQLYASQAATRFWQALPLDGKQLTMTGYGTALTMTSSGTAVTMSGYATNLTLTESNP